MNGINSLGGAQAPNAAPAAADGNNFEAVFNNGLVSTSAVLMQFIGADLIETVMKDEQSVD